VSPSEIDGMLLEYQRSQGLESAPIVGDEQFLRRASLDLTGRLPSPAEVAAFVADSDPAKRSKLIDKLLASEGFNTHWAKYWHDVVVSRATSDLLRRSGLGRPLELWLADQLRAGNNWGEIARQMITASGDLKYDFQKPDAASGPAVFLLCHQGPEAAVERASETARIFLGIQIQCAQCHDHPSDIWKRQQFHDLAAFYSRLGERPIRNPDTNRIEGIRLISRPFGEHQMPNLADPSRPTTVHPRHLTGEAIGRGRGDLERRAALAEWITSKDNYWFSAAFVNRVWGELMGQGFYQPVDAMGPQQEATCPEVLYRLADAFRASDYDIRALFRLIANTQAYQRQIREGESSSEHLHFTAVCSRRVHASSLWQALENALGPLTPPAPALANRPMGRPLGRVFLERQFASLFGFDPSTPAAEVEGSIPQALWLMNSPLVNERLRAYGPTLLAQTLRDCPDDAEAITALYLRTLARKPSERELETCKRYIARVGRRGEAFEDIAWALINSTEFQSRR
jgi:hypothetical protein